MRREVKLGAWVGLVVGITAAAIVVVMFAQRLRSSSGGEGVEWLLIHGSIVGAPVSLFFAPFSLVLGGSRLAAGLMMALGITLNWFVLGALTGWLWSVVRRSR